MLLRTIVTSLLTLFWSLSLVASAANVQVEVIYGQSNLNLILNGPSIQSGTIKGRIMADGTDTVQVYLNSNEILFSNGTSSFKAHLNGTIGGRQVSTAPVFIPISPTNPLLIDLYFDVPQGQFNGGLAPAGFYPATPVLIYALTN